LDLHEAVLLLCSIALPFRFARKFILIHAKGLLEILVENIVNSNIIDKNVRPMLFY
jgi:hypothetical protein